MSTPNPSSSSASSPSYPPQFSLIRPHLYRSATPSPSHFITLQSLQLNTIISLGPDIPSKSLITWSTSHKINFIHLGSLHPPSPPHPLPTELIKETLELVLSLPNSPMLLVDPSGIYETGMVVACLRRLEGWSLSSALGEYCSLAGAKGRNGNEQFIELFDTDLVSIPPPPLLVPWFFDTVTVVQEFAEPEEL